MSKGVLITADTIRTRKKLGRIAKISLLVLLLFLIVVYIILQVVYSEGKFTIVLDPNQELDSGLAMYESLNDPTPKRELTATAVQFMDNISIKWLPSDINGNYEGSHNGDNYIAYTFYIENQGTEDINYWYSMIIDDVIKNVDVAIRIMIFVNDEKTIYAKANEFNGQAEKGTVKFRDDDDGTIILEKREALTPEEIDKITVVVWIEGDDPDCKDALIGGELKMHMSITEEHIRD